MDFRVDTDSFVTLACLDDAPLGTMRVHHNDSLPQPLWAVVQPSEATQFGLSTDGLSLAVKTAMFKVYVLYCL
jgi:hypothetical protein